MLLTEITLKCHTLACIINNENYVNIGGVMLKNRIFRFLSVFCSIVIAMSCLTFSTVSADNPKGKMYSMYAYVLNDYLYTYGAMSTNNAGESFRNDGSGSYAPNGMIYSEIINFDKNTGPCLVVFLAESKYNAAACHIWKFNNETEKAERIGVLDVNYTTLTDGRVGVFSLGCSEENKNFISYKTFIDGMQSSTAYYTVMNGDAFRYINNPEVKNEVGVMDFSSTYFHPGVNIANGNKNMNEFFDELKNSAEENISFENVSERIADSDEKQIKTVLKKSLSLESFDIADYNSEDEYKKALDVKESDDDVSKIIGFYNLEDEIYYVRFTTEKSNYNYAMLRKSDNAENGYQILKSGKDGIPLTDSELKQLKPDYVRNTLLDSKSKSSVKILGAKDSSKGESGKKEPIFSFDKIFDKQSRLPAICIGGGIAVALLTILWVYLYSDND